MKQFNQRNLRRLGILGNADGVYRFDLVGLAFLHVLERLPLRPTDGKPLAHLASFGIAWHALAYRHAYDGDAERTLLWDRDLGPRIEAWQAGVALLRDEQMFGPEAIAEVARVVTDPTLSWNGWTAQATWLRAEIMRRRKFRHTPERFLLRWGNGKLAFVGDANAPFNDPKNVIDPRHAGAAIVLDLERLAVDLIAGAGRPFVTVRIGT